MTAKPLLRLRGITKAFPGIVANDRIDLDVHAGEVHAVVGENGAGKSTLVKILYGFYRADAGTIELDGRAVAVRSPHDARALRIGMVFQELVQVPALSVAENIALFLPDLPRVIDRRALARRIEEVSARYRLDVDPRAPLWTLSVGERQRVEIVKLLLADARVLVLDEPTRGLAPHEVESLLAIFTSLRRDGYAVVFITHKLREVLAAADRITVLRRGVVAGAMSRADASEAALVALMFGPPGGGERVGGGAGAGRGSDGSKEGLQGRSATSCPSVAPAPAAGTRPTSDAHTPARLVSTSSAATSAVLELQRVSARPEGRETGLVDFDLQIAAGEVVGIAGVAGNGQRELGDVILGVTPVTSGAKYLYGENATRWSVARVRGSGVAFVPEDALSMAAVGGLTILENFALGETRAYARHGGVSMAWDAARGDLERALGRLGVSIPSPDRPLGTLSGGNVQRMVLARELARDPRLVVAFYPTRGLDVRSAVAARERLLAARDAGAGVLLISEDLDELFALSDRLVVLFRGRNVGGGVPAELTHETVGHLMTGTTAAHV
jgi:simple sugar transport system ATP-binding protein